MGACGPTWGRPDGHVGGRQRGAAGAGIQAGGETFDASAAPAAGEYKFDSVLTEEHSDDLLSDGIVGLAHLARRTLLKPGGVFYPKAAMVYCALASIRTTTVQGQKCVFDSRLFNVFRNTQLDVVYDLEEVYLNEPGCGALLSRPVPIWGIDLNEPPSLAAPIQEKSPCARLQLNFVSVPSIVANSS